MVVVTWTISILEFDGQTCFCTFGDQHWRFFCFGDDEDGNYEQMVMTVVVVLVMTVATVTVTKGAERRQARGVTISAERAGCSRGPPVEQVLVSRLCWKGVQSVAGNMFRLFRHLMKKTCSQGVFTAGSLKVLTINDGLDSDDEEDVDEDVGGVDDENLGGDEQTIALEESNLFLVHKNQHLNKINCINIVTIKHF